MRVHMSNAFAIFVLFFGVALIDAVQHGPWTRVLFWLVVGVLFLVMARGWQGPRVSGPAEDRRAPGR